MHKPVASIAEPDRKDPVRYGEYLATMGHCTVCHSLGSTGSRDRDDDWLAGSDNAMELKGVGKVWAANLTPSTKGGLGARSAEDVKLQILSGRRKDGKPTAPPMSLFTP